jgi:8-oxo-dGTP pyrophosphatase MutT (NUDIX family)
VHENRFVSVEAVAADFGGFSKSYYVVDFGPRAGVVAVQDDRVLLTAQYRFLVDGVAWEIPGGRVDEGESPIAAAERECFEETGIFCADLQPLITYRPGLDNVENLTSVFYSERVEARRAFAPDPSEVLALAWVPLDDCVALILDRHIVEALTVSAVLAYRCLTARRRPPVRSASAGHGPRSPRA